MSSDMCMADDVKRAPNSSWRPIVIPTEIYELARKHYDQNRNELRLKNGVRSYTGFLNYCIREYFKEKGII